MKDERFSDWLKRYLFACLLVDWRRWGICIMSIALYSLPIEDYRGGIIDGYLSIFFIIFGVDIHFQCENYANRNGWMSMLKRERGHYTTLTFQIKHHRNFGL